MTSPQFLICTMWCGELDYPHHIESLVNQPGVIIEHRVFKDMVEVDGHNAVYQAFNAAPPDVIRAKIDADVVLHTNVLASIAQMVHANTWLDPQTHDYFTDNALFAGVAFYGPTVRFKHQSLTLKCDRNVAQYGDHKTMGVIGTHAHHADEWTGFRYGFHRGLKSQLPVFDMMSAAHRKNQDVVRLAAIRGFELAQSDMYIDYHVKGSEPPMDHNYSNPKLRELYDLYHVQEKKIPSRTWR